ncbi:MAG: lysozyme [Elusimicrobia bacterium]|nr:lysozyme [Elusimicrobiota bacterium]
MKLLDLLIKHEGLELKPYTDTTGHLTIGVGRNLTSNGISKEEAQFMLSNDINDVCRELSIKIPWAMSLDEVRFAVIQDLCFNLGIDKLLTFQKFLEFLKESDYISAANDLLNTLWAKQVGIRAKEDAKMMETGLWPDDPSFNLVC